MSRPRWLELARDVMAVARERQLSIKSAGLAYHAFNTLVPLVILGLVAATLVEAFEPLLRSVTEAFELEDVVTDEMLEEAAGDAGARFRAAALALVILLWSAARLFQAVNSAFTDVYDSRDDQSYVGSVATVTAVTVLNAVLVTLTIAFAIGLVSVVGISVPVRGDGLLVAVGSAVVLALLLPVIFFPMYYLFPQVDVSATEVLPGTALAALSWTVLALGFRVYVATSESVALFGIAGAILLILTWVYLGGFCLLLGAILNAVLADRVDPDREWVPMREVWLEDA
jgi:membrane protein